MTGYITEIPYPNVYHRELNPSFHTLALQAGGFAAPARGAALTYLELGCAWGLSTLIHAAAYPDSKFVGVDFNGECITAAQDIAKRAGLDNVEFLQADFADLPARDLPQFDCVVMHGVWGWIDSPGRAHIVKTLEKHLKPGGVVFVSYNALPGNAQVDALRRLLRVGFDLAAPPLANKVEAGVGLALQVKEIGARFFTFNTMMADRMEHMIKNQPRDYLAHEYFNSHWTPFYFADVAELLQPAGLNYATSCHLLDMIDDAQIPENGRRQIASAPTMASRETLRDFYLNTLFRRDIWVKGELTRGASPQADLMDTQFVSGQSVKHFDRIAGYAMMGEVKPKAEPGRAVVGALENTPMSANELVKLPELSKVDPAGLMETMMVLSALGAAEPVLPKAGYEARKARTDKLNAVICETTLSARSGQGREWTALASPVTGGGVAMNSLFQAFITAKLEGKDPIAYAATFTPPNMTEQVVQAYEGFATDIGKTFTVLGLL